MAAYGMTQPVAHRRMPRYAMVTLLLAATLAVGVGVGRTTSPGPQVRWYPTTTLTSPWRTHWIDAVNRMERQQGGAETPRSQM